MKKILIFIVLFTLPSVFYAQTFNLSNCKWDSNNTVAGATHEYCVSMVSSGSGNQDVTVNFLPPTGTASGWDISTARVFFTNMTGGSAWTSRERFGGTISFEFKDPIFDGQGARLCVSAKHDGTSAWMNSTTTNVVPGASSCSNAIPLVVTVPVELTQFDVETRGNDAYLTWTTATEENNSHFAIERSVNGLDFEEIGRVEGNGFSQSEISYAYTDVNASSVAETVYYRLVQYDYDATTGDASRIRTASFVAKEEVIVSPNPATGGEDVTILGNNINTVNVYDVEGQLMNQYEFNGQNAVTINTTSLSQGVYVVVINENTTRKLVIK